MRRVARVAIVAAAALPACNQSQDLGNNDQGSLARPEAGILCVGPFADFKLDDRYLYCLSEGCVAAVDKAQSTTLGDLARTDYCTGDIEAWSVAADGTRVYVSGFGSENADQAGYVYSAGMDQSDNVHLAPLFGGNTGASDDPKRFEMALAVLVDGSHVFFATEKAIMVAPKVGAAGSLDYSILAPAAPPYDPSIPLKPYGSKFAQDDTNIYWVEQGRLMMVPKAGGAVDTLVVVPAQFRAIATAGGWVYFTTCASAGPGHVGRVSPATHDVQYIESYPGCAFTGVAADETYVYWSASSTTCDQESKGGGSIMRAPVAGGESETFADAQECPSFVLVDGTAVYWMTNGPTDGGEVVRRAPK